jgi:hypothetical protein
MLDGWNRSLEENVKFFHKPHQLPPNAKLSGRLTRRTT